MRFLRRWNAYRVAQIAAQDKAVDDFIAAMKPAPDEEPLFDWKRYEQELPFTAEHIAAQVARKQESLRRLNRRQP